MLHRPAGLRLAALEDQHAAHRPLDGLQHALLAEDLPAVQQEIDVSGVDPVVDGDERTVVGLALLDEVVAQGPALRPAAHRVLALDHEVDGLVDGGAVAGIPVLGVHPQQETRGVDGAVVEGGVAGIVEMLLCAVLVAAGDGLVPVLERSLAGEVGHVVPAAAGQLCPDQGRGRLLGGPQVVFIAGGVPGIEEDVAHRGRTALDPHHRGFALEFSPDAGEVGGVVPKVSAVVGDLLDHEGRGFLHRRADLVVGQPLGFRRLQRQDRQEAYQ